MGSSRLKLLLLILLLSIVVTTIRVLHDDRYIVVVLNKSGQPLTSFLVGGSAIDTEIEYGLVEDKNHARHQLLIKNKGSLRFWATQGKNRVDGVMRAYLSPGQRGDVQVTVLPNNHYVMGPVKPEYMPESSFERWLSTLRNALPY